MGFFRSIIRFITTLGGLLGNRVDETTDAMSTTPEGVRAAYRQTRDNWVKQYKDVREAVSQLMSVMDQKHAEIKKLQAEQEELETKKRGSVEKFRETRDEKYQTLFQDFHAKVTANDERLKELAAEVTDLERQVGNYKIRLTEMQQKIDNLSRQEAEAIADIVSSKQIIELNDRMANLGTSLHDENLSAIEKSRQRLKSQAKLSDELMGTDQKSLEAEVLAAGRSTAGLDEFSKMLTESETKAKESSERGGQQTDRVL